MRPRSAARMGALLVAAALSGYMLGGCAGDGLEGLPGATELPTLTPPEVTVPEVTIPEITVPDVTLPEVTIPTIPEPDKTGTTTSEATTTAKPPTTTVPATTETETETKTVMETVPTETALAAPTLAETTSAEASSDDDLPWGWIALAVGLGVAGVTLGIILWRRGRDEGSA